MSGTGMSSSARRLEHGGEHGGLDCEACRAWIASRLRCVDDGEAEAGAREHIGTCASCRDAYREQLASAARIARAALARRSDAALPGRRSGRGPFHRHRWLLVWLAVCATIFAVSRVGRGLREDPTLPVVWQAGEVWVGGELLGAEFGPKHGLRGDLVQTGAVGRARVTAGRTTVDVGAATTLLVESAVGRRMRLVGGRVVVEGSLVLNTPFGVVGIDDGECEIVLEEDGLVLVCARGAVELVTAEGARDVRAGESYSTALAADADAPE